MTYDRRSSLVAGLSRLAVWSGQALDAAGDATTALRRDRERLREMMWDGEIDPEELHAIVVRTHDRSTRLERIALGLIERVHSLIALVWDALAQR